MVRNNKNVNLSVILFAQTSVIVRIIRTITPIPTPQNMFLTIGKAVSGVRIDAIKIIARTGLVQIPAADAIAPDLPLSLQPVKIEVFIAIIPGRHWLRVK